MVERGESSVLREKAVNFLAGLRNETPEQVREIIDRMSEQFPDLEKSKIFHLMADNNGQGKNHMSGKATEGDLRPGQSKRGRKGRRKW